MKLSTGQRSRVILLAASLAAVGCSDTTAPWSYAGQWTGQGSLGSGFQLAITLAPQQTVTGTFSAPASGLVPGWTAPLSNGRLFADSVAFDVTVPAQAGGGQLHAHAHQVGASLALGITWPDLSGEGFLLARP